MKGVHSMCEYSLHDVASRPAKVNDKVVTTEFSSARGFAALGEHGAKLVIHDSPPEIAVCLLPGTELAFDDAVRCESAFSLFGNARVNHNVARFRQIDLDDPHVQHDALEFPNGQILKLTELLAGQTATVLQLPVAAQHPEHIKTGQVIRSSESRVALNRVPLRPGMASILMPNQSAVMLWQTVRNSAINLTARIEESVRCLKVHKQPASAGADAENETRFKMDAITVTRPKKPARQNPNKKIEAAA